MTEVDTGAPLLEVEELTVEFLTDGEPLRAVEGVSLRVDAGRTVGLVGESGSGKSVTALAILRLNEGPRTRIRGAVRFQGRDLLALSPSEMRAHRGARIAMVFQDPGASLNPSQRVGRQVGEVLRIHRRLSRAAIDERVVELLTEVGIPEPAERARAYPHELSGGMRQRVMIAMALAGEPALLIADEPTTAVDVTIQAQIVELLARLQRQTGIGILLITHDLGLVADTCDELVVLYAGRVVERGPAAELLRAPLHHYTAGLLASAPRLDGAEERLQEIPGIVPDLEHLPPGCRFQTRCPAAQERCRVEEPPWTTAVERAYRCHFPVAPAGPVP